MDYRTSLRIRRFGLQDGPEIPLVFPYASATTVYRGQPRCLEDVSLFIRVKNCNNSAHRKAHVDQAMARAKLKVDTTKAWDAYRAYEKRLSSAMSKDKGE